MYSVIETGGKQYRVEKGSTLKIEKLELGIGDSVVFDKVLMVQSDTETNIGQPYLESAQVTAQVVAQGRHKKIQVIKFKRRKQHMKQMGHRQDFTEIQITDISAPQLAPQAETEPQSAPQTEPEPQSAPQTEPEPQSAPQTEPQSAPQPAPQQE